jgi:hypothetical protein
MFSVCVFGGLIRIRKEAFSYVIISNHFSVQNSYRPTLMPRKKNPATHISACCRIYFDVPIKFRYEDCD